MNYENLLDYVKDIVIKVGAYQQESKKNQDFNVITKGESIDFVTDIDKNSEDMIVSMIKQKYPEHSFLAEETGTTDTDSDYTWVIDPIDGTTNFVHSYPMHCISIGLKYKETIMLGVVYIPTMNMLFSTIKGQGAYLNDEKLSVSKTADFSQSVIATGFPYFRKTNNVNLPYFDKVVSNVAGIRRSGSAAIDLAFVSAGMLDGYWEFALNEWDMCAGIILIEEAGGKVYLTVQDDYPLIICGNPLIYPQLEAYIKK